MGDCVPIMVPFSSGATDAPVSYLFEVTGIASVFSVHSARSTALASIEEFALLGQKTA